MGFMTASMDVTFTWDGCRYETTCDFWRIIFEKVGTPEGEDLFQAGLKVGMVKKTDEGGIYAN